MRNLTEILAPLRVLADAASPRRVDATSSRPVDAVSSPRLLRTPTSSLTRWGHRVYGFAAASLSLSLLLLLAAAPLSPARANSVWDAVEAGHLTWSGAASTNWLANGDFVITYTNTPGNTSTTSTLHLPGWTKAWALAVGGGGAGGDYGNKSTMGAGGGGGAGGFNENNNLTLAGGEGTEGNYSIIVGAGGSKRISGDKATGENGNGSFVRFVGLIPSDVLMSSGGGGGAFKTPGATGGSGGGGAYYSGAANDGGTGIDGQGHDGGQGTYAAASGGGGGAGGVGSPCTSATVAGNGGTAKNSSITGTDVWYAGGGGGGARATGTLGLGGGTSNESQKGGGGNGGNGSNLPQNGVDGLGGGGGGAGSSTYGGKGGDGIVIVRISFVVDGPIEKPTYKELPYTGEEQTVIETIPSVYTVTGQNKATNVSETPYEYTVTLEPGLKWSDGTDAPVVQQWKIVPGSVSVPEKLFDSVVFDEQAHTVVYAVPKMHFTEGSHTNETAAGNYSYTIALDDATNYRWSDDGSSTNKTYHWSITPRPIARQSLPTGLVYSGTNNVAVTNNAYYSFGEGSTTSATNAGTYSVIFSLKDKANNCWEDGTTEDKEEKWTIARLPVAKPPVPGDAGYFVYDGTTKIAATNSIYYTFENSSTIAAKNRGTYYFDCYLTPNYCWNDAVGEAATAPYLVDWYITQAPNKITSITLGDWKLGEEPKTPSVTADFGANTAQYTYSDSETGPWVTDVPETNGIFYVRAYIPVEQKYGNWSSAEKTKRFLIYKSFDELFTDYVDITPEYTGDLIENQPVLVKISEALYPGFSYARCGGGENLGFINQPGTDNETPLSFEVDTWNEKGDSYVWVKVLKLKAGQTKFRMYWHLKDGMVGPGPDAGEVWRDYAGVWHFSETINSTAAPTTPSKDSTDFGYDAFPRLGKDGQGSLGQMVSKDGQIGNARQNASQNYAAGNHLIISNFTSCALGDSFVFSGWVKFSDYASSQAPCILARKNLAEAGGFAMALNATDRKKLNLYGASTTAVATPTIANQELKNGWEYITLAVSNQTYWVYTQSPALGVYSVSGQLNAAVGTEPVPLAFGSDTTGGVASVRGYFDEFRLRKWDTATESTATLFNLARVDYTNTVAATSFLSHGWVVCEGMKQNYWTRYPSLSKTRWDEGDKSVSVDLGAAATGDVAVVYYNIFKQDEPLMALPTTAGDYVAIFTVNVEGFDPLVEEITFMIVGHDPYNVLGATEEGRTLLANDDSQGNWGDTSITNQAYWKTFVTQEDYVKWNVTSQWNARTQKWIIKTNGYEIISTYFTNTTYWTHSGETTASPYRPYLLPGSVHTLETTNQIASLCGGSLLWYLNQICIGNLYPPSLAESSTRNFMPWSLTSCAISSNGVAFSQSEVGNMMMRNTLDASIISPCYTNGIGTIYFDAVNANVDGKPQNYQVQVQIATNVIDQTTREPTGKLPTDENVHEIVVTTNNLEEVEQGLAPPDITVTTNLYALANWQVVSMVPRKFVGGVCTTEGATKTLSLNMQNGGTHSNFYRIVSQLNVAVPARFRLKRVSIDSEHAADLDDYGQILLDNIIVSNPRDWAEVVPEGWYDTTKRGKQVIGYENTWNVPFPSIGDDGVFARGKPIYHLQEGEDASSSDVITKTTMYYRERYLDQRVGSFKTVVLNPYNDFCALTPLELSGLVSDVEFYFISDLKAAYYQYVDYSGSGWGVPGYTEELSSIENRCTTMTPTTSPSAGKDWFVRLREGASDYEQVVLKTDQAQGEIQMELIGNHIWRGYFKTLDPVKAGIRYRIELRNRQEPGARGFMVTNAYWYARDDAKVLPVSSVLQTDGTTNNWAKIPCDATTGYLMFQVDDSTKSISIVHADYQNFDFWNDAKPPEKTNLFTGNSTEDDKKGVSPRMQEYEEDFMYRPDPEGPLVPWTDTPSARSEWLQTFELGGSQEYPDYVPFAESTVVGGWKAGAGMYINQWYRHSTPIPENGGTVRRSLQMEGCGKGWIQFPPSPTIRPRGVATVSFDARLGQFITPDDDVSYAEYPGDDTYVTQNYTFLALAAFDLNSNKDFSGDASLSLFAYFRHRGGGYEVRLEQIKGVVSGTGTSGPANDRRLSLYRWTPGADGSVAATLLGSKDINFTPIKTAGEYGDYMPMYISCSNEVGATVIKFGILRRAKNAKSQWVDGTGFPWETPISQVSSSANYCQFYSMVYRDTSAQRLKRGTYGVLTTNCDGYFLRPHVGTTSVKTTRTEKNTLVEDGNATTVTFPTLVPCRDDIMDLTEPWNVNPGRMETFFDPDSQNWWGLCASPVSQTLILELSPLGKDKWSEVARYTFDDFGSAGHSGTPMSTRLDRPSDYDVRLRVDGQLSDARTDVIVDNIQVTQWRGCDYGDRDTWDFAESFDADKGWRTNFTFSSGWVTNGAVRLSPKRTEGWEPGDKACAIRSPLMDGGDVPTQRGIGLGLISFKWRNAQANANLLVQIATNNIGSSALGYDTIEPGVWTTVTNVDFATKSSADRKEGSFALYLGLHGVKGLMRICADPAVVQQVSPTTWLNQDQYGEVDITEVYCRDEPPVDETAWWGWNLQTTDASSRQYLVDNKAYVSANGLSLGLNNSTTADVEDDPETYKRQMPFVQTPSFVSNTVGEITFRARKYDLSQSQNSEIALYGATFKPGTKDLVWHCSPADRPLARFVVSNSTYATYTYKTTPGEGYKAFRLGVSGIKTVDYETRGVRPTQGETPVRVLIDEVLVSEAIRPQVGFRYCCPIRNAMASGAAVPSAQSRDEQPIMGDSWSVQAEIEVKLLPDEVDLKTHKPRVFFHWYCGETPWGFAKWRGNEKAKSAELALAEDEDMIFRGSYLTAPNAVVMAEPATATYTYRVYQYAAEVVYWDVKGNCITGVLDQTEWERPEWYAPLDLNATKGGTYKDAPFAAYNILESVSPGRAWINEANVFDGRTPNYEYPASDKQYIEVAVPFSQSLRNWRLYYVDNNIKTNLLCIFGQNGVAESKTVNATNNYVFLTVQSKAAAKAGTLDASKGQVDGTWEPLYSGDTKAELDETHPIGLILMRPSGVLAQEIVLEGTNTWAGTAYEQRYSAERRVQTLNATDPEKQWYLAGNEFDGTLTTSLGVTNVAVAAARASEVVPTDVWMSHGTKTPGSCNAGETIPEGYAIFPSGDMVLVNAMISSPHIRQTFGEATNTVATVLVATKKEGAGTNITYHLDQWYEIGEIRENNVLKASGGGDGFVYTAAKDSSESVITVTATARPRKDLREQYGLDANNPYTDAVMKWLEGGKTLKGEDFAYPGNIDLPEFRDYGDNYVTNLTLTETYWFDIDPTGSNWCYRAGTAPPGPYEVYVHFTRDSAGRLHYDPAGDVIKTNIRQHVYMVITNRSETGVQAGRNWSPYVLRGVIPDTHSQQYAAGLTNSWEAVNFKITGDIQNGLPLRARWVPLRYFVFTDGSFDENNISVVDVPYPYSSDSLGVNYGWMNFVGTQVLYKWSIDPRVAPVAIETLAPTNAITW